MESVSGKNRTNLKALTAGFVLFMALFIPQLTFAQKSKGTMELGLAAHYNVPQQDVSDLEPGMGYNIVFHYWLTSTTTVTGTLDYMSYEWPLEVDGEDESLDYTAWVLSVGIRYRPELDLWVRPYGEAGLGYQSWTTYPGVSGIDSRQGGSVAYYAGLGFERELFHAFTVGFNARYFYMPMNERLESEARSTGGDYKIDKTSIRDVSFMNAGLEFTWKFR